MIKASRTVAWSAPLNSITSGILVQNVCAPILYLLVCLVTLMLIVSNSRYMPENRKDEAKFSHRTLQALMRLTDKTAQADSYHIRLELQHELEIGNEACTWEAGRCCVAKVTT